MSDRRKNVRVSHQDSVRFEAEDGVVEGRSLDISRTGMQIVVDLPTTDSGTQSISFSLPNADQPVRIPVRITRSDTEHAEGSRVGVEFRFDAAEQMRLIDRYIREQKEQVIKAEPQVEEARLIPRCDCSITEVQVDGLSAPRIANISTEGMLLEFDGSVLPGGLVDIVFTLPGERKEIRATGIAVYVVQEGLGDRSIAGLQFVTVKEVDRARIRNFILGSTSSSSVRSLHRQMEGEAEFTIADRSRVLTILEDVARKNGTLHLLLGDERQIQTGRIVAIDSETRVVTIEVETPFSSGHDKQTVVYLSFHHDRGSYLFSSQLVESSSSSLLVTLPDRLFRTEKRSYQRKTIDQSQAVRFANGVVAMLLDISSRGFLCSFELAPEREIPFTIGDSVSYEIDDALELDAYGEIRHLTTVERSDGTRDIQLGIEAGIRRGSFHFVQIDESEWAIEEEFPSDAVAQALKLESRPISIQNPEGKKIVGLYNTTGSNNAPVILVPPAFGKKKETLAPLVATLLANAVAAGLDLIVVRFDGINRPGESYNDNPNSARGYEMLHYRPRQGVEDIDAVIDYIYDNPNFTPDGVALFTSSMSSVDARKFLYQRNRDRVHAWVSLMGVPAAQTTLHNILAGTDIIANSKIGVHNGVRGMLGHLVDMDLLAGDLIDEKYAYLTDARYDMAGLSLPILWIYGAYDRWVDAEEVKDLMSIASSAPRELVEVPTGHNLRGSRDAVEAFKITVEFLFRVLHGQTVTPLSPPKEQTIELVTRERERLEDAESLEMDSYWHHYLMGNDRNEEGYDFYRNFREFRDFMAFQVELLGLDTGDRLADMGCGTGVVSEAVLQLAAAQRIVVPGRVVGVDLVPAALERARRKCERLKSAHPGLNACELDFVARNLEPDRLIPIAEFIENGARDIGKLKNRVEGLTIRDVEAIDRVYDGELSQYLRGEAEPEGLVARLRKALTAREVEVLLDLRAAAIYLGKDDRSPGSTLQSQRLKLPRARQPEDLGPTPGSVDKLIASLFISYIFNPDYLIAGFRRLLRPGGTILISSMRPDSDVSMIFTDYVNEVHDQGDDAATSHELAGAQAILSEAAALFELEEEGYFRFYTEEELGALLTDAGFTGVETFRSLGTPTQAVIARGYAP